ncbi:MAG: TetR/AcrR family transcriptional regulator [Burkholderiaceae bacterium]|jgi:TetR/AcrR family transcriptional repressor of nem operon
MNAVTNTKQKLIDTALELIWTSSYGAVSVDDICKAAGVKKGSFYHFFPSKVDLAMAAMEESFVDVKPAYDAMFSASTPPLERFAKLADYTYEAQRTYAEERGRVVGCPCTSLGCEMSGQEPGIREKFDENMHRMERYYEQAVRDLVVEEVLPADTDVKAKAKEIYAYLLGQMMIARIQNDLTPLQRDLKAGLWRILGVEAKMYEAHTEN